MIIDRCGCSSESQADEDEQLMKEAMDVLSTKILSRNLRHLASVTSHIHQRCSLGLRS